MANKEEKQINPWDLLRADVKMYQADCLLSIGFDTQCQRCTKNVFASIINMIDKYAKQAGSGAPERKTDKWINTGIIGNPVRMGRWPKCLEIVSYDAETGISFDDYKFCPFCGQPKEVR